MSIPAFLASSFFYFLRTAVVDVQTIIDDFQAQVLANVPAWTNPSTDVYVSPVDGFGRFMRLEFTRVDAQTLTIVIKDQNGITIATRMIVIPSANSSDIRIYTGQFHFAIDCLTGTANPEFICGGILDLSPESQNTHSRYVWAIGPRGPSSYTNYYWENAAMLDNITAAITQRLGVFYIPWGGDNPPIPMIDSMGFWESQSIMMYVQRDGTSARYYAGRAYQMVFVSRLAGADGTELILPIDAGVTGTFKIIFDVGHTDNYGFLIAVRIA
jgi:hypothetical protein